MDFKKKIILLFVFALLGFQFLVVISPYKILIRNSWPFLNYPMYSKIYHHGEEFNLTELYVNNSETNTNLKVRFQDLRIMKRRLNVLLRNADKYLTNEKADSTSFKYLNRILRKNFPPEFNTAKIITKKYIMTENGFEFIDDPEIREIIWRINI